MLSRSKRRSQLGDTDSAGERPVLASTLKGVTAVWILITTDYLVPGDDNAAGRRGPTPHQLATAAASAARNAHRCEHSTLWHPTRSGGPSNGRAGRRFNS